MSNGGLFRLWAAVLAVLVIGIGGVRLLYVRASQSGFGDGSALVAGLAPQAVAASAAPHVAAADPGPGVVAESGTAEARGALPLAPQLTSATPSPGADAQSTMENVAGTAPAPSPAAIPVAASLGAAEPAVAAGSAARQGGWAESNPAETGSAVAAPADGDTARTTAVSSQPWPESAKIFPPDYQPSPGAREHRAVRRITARRWGPRSYAGRRFNSFEPPLPVTAIGSGG